MIADDGWRDGYDAWKLASPPEYDDNDICCHEEREIDWSGYATCHRCGVGWFASTQEIAAERELNERFDAYWRREERRVWIDGVIRKLAFWRKWRRPTPTDDDLPF